MEMLKAALKARAPKHDEATSDMAPAGDPAMTMGQQPQQQGHHDAAEAVMSKLRADPELLAAVQKIMGKLEMAEEAQESPQKEAQEMPDGDEGTEGVDTEIVQKMSEPDKMMLEGNKPKTLAGKAKLAALSRFKARA